MVEAGVLDWHRSDVWWESLAAQQLTPLKEGFKNLCQSSNSLALANSMLRKVQYISCYGVFFLSQNLEEELESLLAECWGAADGLMIKDSRCLAEQFSFQENSEEVWVWNRGMMCGEIGTAEF